MPLNNNFGLGFIFSATDNASKVMKRVNRNFQKFDKSTTDAQKRIQAAQGTVTAGLAAMATGAIAVRQLMGAAFNAGIFEQQAQRVGAIAQASAETLDLLREKALAAGLATQFSPTETIMGLGELTVRGLTATEAMDALQGSLDLAAGGMISIQSAASTTVSALKVFSLEASGAVLAADKLLKISNLTALAAGDLELALGTVGRGASATKQSLDEMLISMGLVKNTGVDASVAASSVSSALLFAAKSADKFKKIGVEVTDATGAFRPFVDIVLDTHKALSGITDAADRTAKVQKLFGRFGITAFSAISSQLAAGIKTSTGEMLRGTKALEFMRKTMAGAAGTAERFRDVILNTLPGQLTLLRGTMQTFGVVFGKSIAEITKPIVTFFRDTIAKIIKVFQGLPKPLQKILAVGSLVAGMFVFMGGAALLLVGTFILALPIIKATMAAFAAFIPLLQAVALAALAVAGVMFTLKKAFDLNLGGFGDTIRSVLGGVKLFFEGLFQFMEDGFFSGDTAKKLGQPENAPVMQFLITLIRFGFRVQRFFQGMSAGFNKFLIANSGAFGALGDAIKSMGEALGLTSQAADDALGPSSGFAKFGAVVGKALAAAFVFVIRVVTILIRVATGLWKGMMVGIKLMSPFFTLIMDAFMGIVDAVNEVLTAFGVVTGAGDGVGDMWEAIGMAIGFIRTAMLLPLIATFAFFMSRIKFIAKQVAGSITFVIAIFKNFWTLLQGIWKFVTGDFSGGWAMMGDAAKGSLDALLTFFSKTFDNIKSEFNTLLDFIANLAAQIPDAARPAFLDDFIATREHRKNQIISSEEDERAEAQRFSLSQMNALASQPAAYVNRTAGAAEAGAGPGGAATADDFKTAMSEVLEEFARNRTKKPQQKQTINLIADGAVMATAQASAGQKDAALNFGGDFFGGD